MKIWSWASSILVTSTYTISPCLLVLGLVAADKCEAFSGQPGIPGHSWGTYWTTVNVLMIPYDGLCWNLRPRTNVRHFLDTHHGGISVHPRGIFWTIAIIPVIPYGVPTVRIPLVCILSGISIHVTLLENCKSFRNGVTGREEKCWTSRLIIIWHPDHVLVEQNEWHL